MNGLSQQNNAEYPASEFSWKGSSRAVKPELKVQAPAPASGI